MIVDRHEDLSTTGFARHKDALLDLGVMVEADKRGNAQQYALNTKHPIAQLLQTLNSVMMWSRTPQMLEEQFRFEGDASDLESALAAEQIDAPTSETNE